MCPRSSSLFTYIVPYYIKWVTTSWTYSTWLEGKWIIFGKRSVHFDPFKAFVYISRSVKHRQFLLAINSSLMVSMRKIHLPFSHVLKQPWFDQSNIFYNYTATTFFTRNCLILSFILLQIFPCGKIEKYNGWEGYSMLKKFRPFLSSDLLYKMDKTSWTYSETKVKKEQCVSTFLSYIVCPRSLVHFKEAICYIKMDKSSWTNSTRILSVSIIWTPSKTVSLICSRHLSTSVIIRTTTRRELIVLVQYV